MFHTFVSKRARSPTSGTPAFRRQCRWPQLHWRRGPGPAAQTPISSRRCDRDCSRSFRVPQRRNQLSPDARDADFSSPRRDSTKRLISALGSPRTGDCCLPVQSIGNEFEKHSEGEFYSKPARLADLQGLRALLARNCETDRAQATGWRMRSVISARADTAPPRAFHEPISSTNCSFVEARRAARILD